MQMALAIKKHLFRKITGSKPQFLKIKIVSVITELLMSGRKIIYVH